MGKLCSVNLMNTVAILYVCVCLCRIYETGIVVPQWIIELFIPVKFPSKFD